MTEAHGQDRGNARAPAAPARRILIAGSSGAGKSTLARDLARLLDLPYTELDSLFHGPDWIPLESFEADVAAIVESEAWVSEWQYPSVRAQLLGRAEMLVCLDYSRLVVMKRIVMRTLRRRFGRIELWNGNTEPPLWTFFVDADHIVRWSWSTFGANRRTMRAVATHPPPGCLTVRLASPRATRRWLQQLTAGLG